MSECSGPRSSDGRNPALTEAVALQDHPVRRQAFLDPPRGSQGQRQLQRLVLRRHAAGDDAGALHNRDDRGRKARDQPAVCGGGARKGHRDQLCPLRDWSRVDAGQPVAAGWLRVGWHLGLRTAVSGSDGGGTFLPPGASDPGLAGGDPVVPPGDLPRLLGSPVGPLGGREVKVGVLVLGVLAVGVTTGEVWSADDSVVIWCSSAACPRTVSAKNPAVTTRANARLAPTVRRCDTMLQWGRLGQRT